MVLFSCKVVTWNPNSLYGDRYGQYQISMYSEVKVYCSTVCSGSQGLVSVIMTNHFGSQILVLLSLFTHLGLQSPLPGFELSHSFSDIYIRSSILLHLTYQVPLNTRTEKPLSKQLATEITSSLDLLARHLPFGFWG